MVQKKFRLAQVVGHVPSAYPPETAGANTLGLSLQHIDTITNIALKLSQPADDQAQSHPANPGQRYTKNTSCRYAWDPNKAMKLYLRRQCRFLSE